MPCTHYEWLTFTDWDGSEYRVCAVCNMRLDDAA